MLVDKINKWIESEEEWFFDFLTEMTRNGVYGDDISGAYPDYVELDGDFINASYHSYNRCGDSDYYSASIPLVDVVKKLRKEKLEYLKNNN